MREVLFKELLHDVAGQLGWDPEALQANQAAQLTRYLQRSYRICHGWHDWPEAMTLGEEMAVSGGVIPWLNTSTRPPLAMVRNVYKTDPALTDDEPAAAKWRMGPAGIHLVNKDRTLETVWVDYREEAPILTSLDWTAARSYQYNGLFPAAYNPADGSCYACISEVPVAAVGLADATVWRRQVLLRCLAEATVLHAYASALEEQDQFAKAGAKRAEAEALLEQEALIYRHQTGARKNYLTTNRP